MALNATLNLTGRSTHTSATDLSTPSDPVAIGSGGFDAMELRIADGTGADQAGKHWHDERTVNAGANDDLDLTALTGAFGTVSFSRVMVVLVDVDSPDGSKKLRVGPQAVANAWQAWHGGVAAGNYEDVFQQVYRTNTKAATPGWTVTNASSDVLRIHNPGASAVTYRILLIGV